MAVAAGRAADPGATAQRVVLVSRDFPLLEGGNGAVLLAALSLAADVAVSEVLGGAPAVLDQLSSAPEGTLVLAADDSASTAAAGAVLTGPSGTRLEPAARQTRSLPTVTRGEDGVRRDYGDPRLQREVGVKSHDRTARFDQRAYGGSCRGREGQGTRRRPGRDRRARVPGLVGVRRHPVAGRPGREPAQRRTADRRRTSQRDGRRRDPRAGRHHNHSRRDDDG